MHWIVALEEIVSSEGPSSIGQGTLTDFTQISSLSHCVLFVCLFVFLE